MSSSLGTNYRHCKEMSRLGSPLLPAPTCQDAGRGSNGCRPEDTSQELRGSPQGGADRAIGAGGPG